MHWAACHLLAARDVEAAVNMYMWVNHTGNANWQYLCKASGLSQYSHDGLKTAPPGGSPASSLPKVWGTPMLKATYANFPLHAIHTHCRRHGLPCEALALARCRWHEHDPAFARLLERMAAAAAAAAATAPTASAATPAAASRCEAPAATQQPQPHATQQEQQELEQQAAQGPLDSHGGQHTSLELGGSSSQEHSVTDNAPHSVGVKGQGGHEERGDAASPAGSGGRAAEPRVATITITEGSSLQLGPPEPAPSEVAMAGASGDSAPSGSPAAGPPSATALSPRSKTDGGGGGGAAAAAAALLSAPVRSPSPESLALQFLVAGRPLAAAQALRTAAVSLGPATSPGQGQGPGRSGGGSASGKARGDAGVAEAEGLVAAEVALQRLVTAAELCARAALATAAPQVGSGCLGLQPRQCMQVRIRAWCWGYNTG